MSKELSQDTLDILSLLVSDELQYERFVNQYWLHDENGEERSKNVKEELEEFYEGLRRRKIRVQYEEKVSLGFINAVIRKDE